MQQISSKDTSLNIVPAVYTKCNFPVGSTVLDYGGGKYDTAKTHMRQQQVIVEVYDKYNRSEEENKRVLSKFRKCPADIVVCSNVLNVIQETDVIVGILHDIMQYIAPNGTIYIQVYEGDKTGVGKVTTKGYQRNMKAVQYMPMLSCIFLNAQVTRKGNIFIIQG